jgi:hypothetical protein
LTRPQLMQCEGFGVYGPNSRIGTVEEVRLGGGGRPVSLLVRAGLTGTWLLHVPFDQVDEISSREERVVLRAGGLLAGPRTSEEGSRAA